MTSFSALLVSVRAAALCRIPARRAMPRRPSTDRHPFSTRGADVGQDLVGRGDVAPARVQAGVDVLHHVLGSGQVPDHEQGQPDQFAVVLAEQRAHGTGGLVC
jgi:hypothetical protein